jgi:hypothetical protein
MVSYFIFLLNQIHLFPAAKRAAWNKQRVSAEGKVQQNKEKTNRVL